MGQPITVVQKKSHRPGIVRFEINRPLTGMGHERYRLGDTIDGVRPPDELARRLLARGGVDAVHIYDNMITVDLAKGASDEGLLDTIRELFLFYREPSAPDQEPRVDEGDPLAAT
jgi:hypothetical protein